MFHKLIIPVISLTIGISSFSASSMLNDKDEVTRKAPPFKSFDTSDVNPDMKTNYSRCLSHKRNICQIEKEIENSKTISELVPIGTHYVGIFADYKGEVITTHSMRASKGLKNEKQYLIKQIQDMKPKDLKGFKTFDTQDQLSLENKGRTFWGESSRINPEDKVEIVHGGGLIYLLDILEGNRNGYTLEGNIKGKGIQVHPTVSTDLTAQNLNEIYFRTFQYADKTTRRWDFPTYLTGKIEARYLDAAPNSYEAGLRSIFINKIENPTLFTRGLYVKKEHKEDNWEYGFIASNIHQSLIGRVAKINKPRHFNALNLEIKGLGSKPTVNYNSKNGTFRAL